MFTRIDKAIAAGMSAGGLVLGYTQGIGDPHHYGIAAAAVIGVLVGIFTFVVPNRAAA